MAPRLQHSHGASADRRLPLWLLLLPVAVEIVMLAHFAFPELTLSLRVVAVASVLAAALAYAGTAGAADLSPPGTLDARAVAAPSDGSVAAPGSVSAALRVDSTASAASAAAAPSAAGRAGLLLGAGLAKRLELSLGLHASSEPVASAQAATGGFVAPKTGFADASLLVKAQLFDYQGWQLALAPFVESGAGAAAAKAVTRSVGAKGGAMALLSYGAKHLAEVTLNGGLRYRSSEATGDVLLRNEQFYRAGVESYATRTFSLFAAVSGRRLEVAAAAPAGKADYHPATSSQVEAGAGLHFGAAAVAASAATRLGQASAFGYGDRTFVVALSWELTHAAARHTAQASGDAGGRMGPPAPVAARKAKLVPAAQTPSAAAPTAAQANVAVDAIGTNVDPFGALGDTGPDEFTEAEKRAEQNRKDSQTESEDARIERELKEIREVEAKADAERAQTDLSEAAERRRQANAKAKADDALEREWMDEAKKSADSLDGITKDQLQWNGLQ